jgi:transposase
MTGDLLAMRDWLIGQGITVVGMKATGAYWKPVFYLLESQMTCWMLNLNIYGYALLPAVARQPGR